MAGREAAAELPTVYDVGMNNGDDSAYYLAKGYRVIGIDANPEMCIRCNHRFAAEVSQGRMSVLNVGVSDRQGALDFHINEAKPAISTFVPERFAKEEWVQQHWRTIEVPVERLSDIIRSYGDPFFIKIDVEFYDKFVLTDLLLNGIRPPLISAEAHEVEIYCALVCMGYEKFRFVPGETVPQNYQNVPISCLDGSDLRYDFLLDSSGPFGDDLVAPWLNKEQALRQLLETGCGWIDVHAAL